jgi:hypothetical protein
MSDNTRDEVRNLLSNVSKCGTVCTRSFVLHTLLLPVLGTEVKLDSSVCVKDEVL